MSRKTLRRLLRLMSRVPGLYALLAFAVTRRVSVRGWSMSPALLPGDRLLFDRLAYMRDRPRAGDIVLVAHPLTDGLRLVKRLAGVPGQAVEGGRVLARGEYWVLGDNEDESTDSREIGPVRRSHLLGRAWVRYWPTERWEVFQTEEPEKPANVCRAGR
ncbi:MAG TPA: signal peptidase I [Dehalococcoidia bacterium]|nr:signal peptidase I [Dehalococcoidia bacterium]